MTFSIDLKYRSEFFTQKQKIYWAESQIAYGLFIYMKTEMGSDPYPEGFPVNWVMAIVVSQRNIHTAHKREQLPIPKYSVRPLNSHCTHFRNRSHPQTGIQVRLRVCEWAITGDFIAD